jgi:predicted CXXCH cytochrome family protein
MKSKLSLFLIGAVLFVSSGVYAQDKPVQYVGANKCKICHKPQFTKWSEAAHSNALKSLSSEKALEYGKKNGIADPSKDAKCLNCHSTAATVDKNLLTKTITIEEGVSCESCHGPGSKYKSPKIMSKKAYGADAEAARKAAMDAGLILPTKEVCESCHNEKNPFHKPFDYEKSKGKIAHPTPPKN